MHARRSFSKIIGLCALVFLATSIAASAGQVEAEWLLAKKPLAAFRIFQQTANWSAGKELTLAVPWYASEIECTTQKSTGNLFPEGRTASTIALSSCTLLGPPFIATTCKLIQPIEFAVASEAVAQSGKYFSVFTSQSAEQPIAKVRFEKSAECPLPLENSISGSFVAEHESGEQVTQTLTFSAEIDESFPGNTLKFGTHPATLHGNAAMTVAEKEWGLAAPPWSLGGEFKVGGKALLGSKSFKATIGSSGLSAAGVELQCNDALVTGTFSAGGTLGASALFLTCSIKNVKACQFYLSESDALAHKNSNPNVSIEVSGELMSSGEERFMRFKGHPFIDLWIEDQSGKEMCPLPFENEISGSIAIKLPNALKELKSQALESINVKSEEALGVVPFIFGSPATLAGAATAELVSQETWSVK
jgi:hypothetical protein